MAFKARGLTLVEVLITIALIGIGSVMASMGFRLYHQALRQRAQVELQQQAQATLYEITRHVRNAREIKEASPSKLELTVFNPRLGYNNPDMYLAANLGRIIYEYKTEGPRTYLVRTSSFSNIVQTHKLLSDQLLAPTATDFIFKGIPENAPPFESVQVYLRLSAKNTQTNEPLIFWKEIMKRTATQ